MTWARLIVFWVTASDYGWQGEESLDGAVESCTDDAKRVLGARLRDLHRRLRGASDVAEDVKAAMEPLIDAAGDVVAQDWRCFNEDYAYWYAESPAPPVLPLFPSIAAPPPSSDSMHELTGEDWDRDTRPERLVRLSTANAKFPRPLARQRGEPQIVGEGVDPDADRPSPEQAASSVSPSMVEKGRERLDMRAFIASFTPGWEVSRQMIRRFSLASSHPRPRPDEDGKSGAAAPWWRSLPQSLLAQVTATGGHGPYAGSGGKPRIAVKGH
jgi:hypothetical protein